MGTHTYIGDKNIEPRIGDVVMTRDEMRGIVIGIDGTMLSVLGIGTHKETGDTFVLPSRHVDVLPVSQCHHLEKQTLNW